MKAVVEWRLSSASPALTLGDCEQQVRPGCGIAAIPAAPGRPSYAARPLPAEEAHLHARKPDQLRLTQNGQVQVLLAQGLWEANDGRYCAPQR